MAVKKHHIGEFRDVGYFENNTSKQPKTAGYVDGYSPIVTSVFCKLRQRSHKKENDFGQVVMISYWEMHCRFQSAIDASLLTDTKFVQGNRVFTIAGFEVVDERDFYYKFTLNLKTK